MGRKTEAADRTVKDIRRQTRKQYSSEEKIRTVLAGLRGEDSIAELSEEMQRLHALLHQRAMYCGS
jgi:transposase